MGPSGLTPVSHADPREFAKVEKTNFTAVYRLIRSLEPLLRASDAGRAIHFTTSVATNPRAFWGMYAATKAGAEALVKPGPTRSKARPCAPASSTPAGCAPPCAPRPIRAKIRPSCPTRPRSARWWWTWRVRTPRRR